MSVSVVGAGGMGRSIARRLSIAGEKIAMTDADLDKTREVADEVTRDTTGSVEVVASVDEAIGGGDVVIFATWFPVTKELVAEHAGALAGKVVVDISNAFNETFDDLTVPWGSSAAEEIAAACPGARVVKAFNTTFAPVLYDGGLDDIPADVFIASDDDDAKAAVADLVTRSGMRAIDAGRLANARILERLTLLQAELVMRYQLDFRGIFKFLPRSAG